MIAGSLKRAPRWVQHLQMEWLFRMAQEPWRLLPRYVNDAVALLRHLPMVLAVSRMQPMETAPGRLRVSLQGSVGGEFRIVATPSTLTGEHCAALVREANGAAEAAQTFIVDMSATTRVEADGLGCLLQARRVTLAAGGWIWLAGMSNPVRRVLQYSAMSDLFRLAMSTAEAIDFTSGDSSEVGWSTRPMPRPQKVQHAPRAAADVVKV
jgi:N-acetylglucosaminyldiphosphoundecaprenol N-acetyl-beta-D-mannosaminyltransferase